MIRFIMMVTAAFLISGCSVFGDSGVEIAPYKVVQAEEDLNIEVRTYDSMILVSTPMEEDIDGSQRKPFMRLFDYISGENVKQSEIAMTAPVFMDKSSDEIKGEKIAMTAPVFMDGERDDDDDDKGVSIEMTAPVFMDEDSEQSVMSFVLPDSFTMETAPLPKNPLVTLEEIKDYKVAVIQFSGLMSEDNLEEHREELEAWIETQGLEVAGPYKYAGYNPPFTLPQFRRNEVLIPVK